MAVEKPTLPKGVRDFGPEKMLKRLHIIDNIRKIYQLHGFLPLETPAIENLSVLTGKYGDEGDQLMFKILNSGNFLNEVILENKDYKKLTPEIAEKALKYDLTVPFARFVAMNRNEIQFPFKRYQIQPVWRADRPQKGRYREFYQCDADIVGTNSLVCEYELIQMAHKVLKVLGIEKFEFKINNRKILSGIVDTIGEPGKEGIICTAIDKLDKIGEEGVIKELIEKGITESSISKLIPVLKISGNNQSKISQLTAFLSGSETGLKGLEELAKVIELAGFTNSENKITFDQALARGLSYYTGAIFEIKVLNVQIGSISGGGRYDNLTGGFGLPDVSGVGISFGIDRIYDVMEELKLFPESHSNTTKILLAVIDEDSAAFALKVSEELRSKGIIAEVYPELGSKMKKQLGYADSRKIPFAGIIGSSESESQTISLKNMITGDQKSCSISELTELLSAIN